MDNFSQKGTKKIKKKAEWLFLNNYPYFGLILITVILGRVIEIKESLIP